MIKPSPNLAASLVLEREASAKITVGMVESLDSAREVAEEDEGAWIDEVTANVAALWGGRRDGVSFAEAMASARDRGGRRR
jgi:hypothetical protein